MKATILTAFTLITLSVNAQTDSSYNKKQDTIKIGNMVIVGANGTKELDKVSWNHDSANKRNKRNGIYIKSFNDTIVSINDDTVKVGRINIINKNESEDPHFKTLVKIGDASYGKEKGGEMGWIKGDFKKTKISIDNGRKENKRIMTNWWILDLGFANYVDHTAPIYYTAIPINGLMPRYVNSNDLKLNNVKSSNVNVWIVQQKANLYKHYLNLKYGVGFEMYNFRFEQPISFTKAPNSAPYFDNVTFSKNKLFVEYLTVPVQLNFQSNPDNSKSFYASIGLSAGYLLQSHTKQISEERGKRKLNGNFNLNNFKMATIGELGIGNIRLYGSLNTTNLFDKNLTHFDMTPFAVGVRFSKF
jgi:hypothetical protein